MRFPFSKKPLAPKAGTTIKTAPPPDLPALCLASGSLAQIMVQGRHGQKRVGAGENFWQFRPHQPHEPASLIDWRQSARSADPDLHWVRERERDVPRTLILWVDPSASMRWASQKSLPDKYSIGLTAALSLGACAMKAGEYVRVLGQKGWYQNIQKLPQLAQNIALPPLPPEVSEAGAIPPVALAPPRASLLLVSDFLWEEEQIAAIFRLCRQRPGRCSLLCVQDPAEVTLPYRGHIRFYDPEDVDGKKHSSITLSAVEELSLAYQKQKQAYNDHLQTMAGQGIKLFTCSTDKPLIEPLMALYQHLGAWKTGTSFLP